jgi:SAM-dependent methyltransferase
MANNKCRVCENENNKEEYILREMMFGTNEEFEYFKCSNCGCLQIKNFSENIGKYYPSNYLSFPEQSSLKKYLLKKRELYVMSGRGLVGKLLTFKFGYPDFYPWFSEANLKKNDFILEVGCGRGELLFKLRDAGFTNLLGIDPYIEKDTVYNENFKILKKELQEISDLFFDWVMFHHSFEHLKDPVKTFEMLKKVVKKNGNVLIRIPVIDSHAWEIYKTNWVQLDPPRHFFLHTVKSIQYLADKFGFKVQKIIYDSSAFQFIGSEQYKKGIPLMSQNSYLINPGNSIFDKEEMNRFEQKAKELNRNSNGDSASFFLQKIE